MRYKHCLSKGQGLADTSTTGHQIMKLRGEAKGDLLRMTATAEQTANRTAQSGYRCAPAKAVLLDHQNTQPDAAGSHRCRQAGGASPDNTNIRPGQHRNSIARDGKVRLQFHFS